MKTYTINQIAEIAKVTPQRINQWRVSKSKSGFKLIEHKDWEWITGNVVYLQSAINKIKMRNEYK